MPFSKLMVDQIEPNLKFNHNFSLGIYHLVYTNLLHPPGNLQEGVPVYYHVSWFIIMPQYLQISQGSPVTHCRSFDKQKNVSKS